MGPLVILLVFLTLLILSNAINKVFPRLPIPFLQILFGIMLGYFLIDRQFEFDTELFLALIIGPLVFREAEEADISSILQHWKIILYLIFPGIFATTFALGGLVSQQMPLLPLAACIAVGAALGPTDLIAFSALAQRFRFSRKSANILQGEGLLNDASGLVTFQVAILAWSSGAFSLAHAGGNLLLQMLGGALVGIVTALLNRWVHNILMRFQAVDVAGELLLELGLPLLTFFLAEEFHVSGIIAVVVAGILKASRFRRINPLEAEVFETTEIVWKALTFMLNGSVFLLFGIEMVFLIDPILTSPVYDTVLLLGLCLALTALLFGIRYVMLRIFYTLQAFFKKEKEEQDLLILTFAGVKGTVSIATILLLPQELKEEYPVLLFLVAGVTILSFLTGLLVLPNLAEPNREEADHLMEIAILTDVMKQLESELYQSQSKTSLYLVLDNYNDRLVNLTIAQEGKTIQEEWTDLMLLILSVENDGLEQAYEDGRISERAYFAYQRYLRAMERRINRSVVSKLTYVLLVVWRVLRLLLHEILTLGASSRQWMHNQNPRLTQDDEDDLAMLYLENTEVIVDALADLQGVYMDSLIQFVQDWRIRETAIIGDGGFVNRVLLREQAYRSKEMLKAYYLERKAIFDYETDGHISSQEANILRSQVNQLESFALKDATPSLSLVRMRRK